MKKLAVFLLGLLLASVAVAQDHFLELRANANAYEKPDRHSEVIAQLRPKAGGAPLLLKQVAAARENGYYNVQVPGTPGRSGWVYKSFVRGTDLAPPASKPAAVVAGVAPSAPASPVQSFGRCKSLFVGGKPPRAPDEVTPLCEEDSDVVFFASGYSKRDNRGYWSAYRLDDEQVNEINEGPHPRPNVKFRQNPQLKGGDYVQPSHDSYTATNWDRGHLAPNGAMAWDEDAQKRSFTISNIAPQKPEMNRNIWRCFEQSIREWADGSGSTFVVVGTLRGNELTKPRDPDDVKINVPSHFIAMVYRSKPTPMAIGAMVPNTEGNLDIRKFIMPVAELEQKSGFGFGIPDSVAAQKPDPKLWPTRVVRKELLGKLPDIDTQCPKAKN